MGVRGVLGVVLVASLVLMSEGTMPFTLLEMDLMVYIKGMKMTIKTAKGSPTAPCDVTLGTVSTGQNSTQSRKLDLTARCNNTAEPTVDVNLNLGLTFMEDAFGYYGLSGIVATVAGTAGGAVSWKDVNMKSQIELVVPKRQSFHCSKFGALYPKVMGTGNFTIELEKLQVEAFMTPGDVTAQRFNPAQDCVGFFSPGIWCGIVVTIMLIAILSWGMKMLMDVKTMDRFDDPKGKPISFGAGE